MCVICACLLFKQKENTINVPVKTRRRTFFSFLSLLDNLFFEELVVCAVLNHPPVVHCDDTVTVFDSREAMSNDDGAASVVFGDHFIQRFLSAADNS